MIHEALMEMLKNEMPDMKWTVNNFTQNDNTGTVYAKGESTRYRYEGAIFYPSYQVLIRSTDWDKAELYANQIRLRLDKMMNKILEAYLYKNQRPVIKHTFELMVLENQGGVIDIGTGEDNAREYSVNFDAVLHLISEEEL